jgi:hypothetical protein
MTITKPLTQTEGQKVRFYVEDTRRVGTILRATPSTQTVMYMDGEAARTADVHHTKLTPVTE